jgi:vancomycin permeability regulator SanA
MRNLFENGKTMRRTILLVLVSALAAAIAAPVVARLLTGSWARARIHASPAEVPPHRVAVVFGAGVRGDQPTAMLYDRVAAAVDLYRAGAAGKLLMSGDNRFENYNEPRVMRRVALDLGVPDRDIALDYAGRSTYDTCYRARAIFGIREAILVTQAFHLDRALMTCAGLGIEAVGYPADRRPYRNLWWNHLRELAATLNALVEVYLTHPLPVLGEPIDIGAVD